MVMNEMRERAQKGPLSLEQILNENIEHNYQQLTKFLQKVLRVYRSVQHSTIFDRILKNQKAGKSY
jgi:hypothetical protein